MSIMDSLIELLSKAVSERRVSVIDLASRMSCSRQHIYDIIERKAKTKVTVSEAEMIAEALNCSIVIKPEKTKREKISA